MTQELFEELLPSDEERFAGGGAPDFSQLPAVSNIYENAPETVFSMIPFLGGPIIITP
jgi:hypothetical protein